MNLHDNMFYGNQLTYEIIDVIQSGGLFLKPFAIPPTFPISVEIVDRNIDLAPYQSTVRPDSKIFGRTWIDVTNENSVPIDSTPAIRASGISFGELSIQTNELIRYLRPFLERVEHAHSLKDGIMEPFVRAGLSGRYFLGNRVEFLYELFLRVIFSGGMPCGWIGAFPDEMKVGLYPLDGRLVVYSVAENI